MSLPDYDDRLRKVRIQLILQIPEGCSPGTVYNSLREKLEASLKKVPIFQVYFNGLDTHLWQLDAKLDNGAVLIKKAYRTKIRSMIQQAFNETLSNCDYQSFSERFTEKGNNNREWMIITEYTEPFPCVPPHYWGLMSVGNELPDFSTKYADAFFGVDAGPGSGGGGRAAAPAAATALDAAATPAPAFPAVDPAALFRGVDLAVAAAAYSGPQQALVGRTLAATAASLAIPLPAPRLLHALRSCRHRWRARSLTQRQADRSAVRDPPRPLRRRTRPAGLQAQPTRRPRRRRARLSRPTLPFASPAASGASAPTAGSGGPQRPRRPIIGWTKIRVSSLVFGVSAFCV